MMDVFYEKRINDGVRELEATESRHCLTVLRHTVGDQILILDGIGGQHLSKIVSDRKKIVEFEILESKHVQIKNFHIHLGIAPTKNVDRMEWMMEKLGEIGVDEITFIHSKNSERSRIRLDRLEKKTISAMKQSGGRFLMKINDLVPLERFIEEAQGEKYIAHLGDSTKYLGEVVSSQKPVCLLIGPEGDFSLSEIEGAEALGFKSVSLGKTTLRTETAGLLACHLINVVNQY